MNIDDERTNTDEILRSLDQIAGRDDRQVTETAKAPEQKLAQTDLAAQPYRVAPANIAIQSLVDRHGDAVAKIRELEDHELDLKLKLRRTADALDYQRKRERGIRHRIVTGRAAIRADEDDAAGIYE